MMRSSICTRPQLFFFHRTPKRVLPCKSGTHTLERCGFAKSQEAYDIAVKEQCLFGMGGRMRKRFLVESLSVVELFCFPPCRQMNSDFIHPCQQHPRCGERSGYRLAPGVVGSAGEGGDPAVEAAVRLRGTFEWTVKETKGDKYIGGATCVDLGGSIPCVLLMRFVVG